MRICCDASPQHLSRKTLHPRSSWRVWVSLILDLLADGLSTEQVLAEYQGLEPDDIRACVAYGAEMTRERVVVIGPGAA